MDAVPEEDEDEGAVSPDTGEGIGIILDIKPKITTVLHQDSGENKIVLDSTQNEKGKEIVSSLWSQELISAWWMKKKSNAI